MAICWTGKHTHHEYQPQTLFTWHSSLRAHTNTKCLLLVWPSQKGSIAFFTVIFPSVSLFQTQWTELMNCCCHLSRAALCVTLTEDTLITVCVRFQESPPFHSEGTQTQDSPLFGPCSLTGDCWNQTTVKQKECRFRLLAMKRSHLRFKATAAAGVCVHLRLSRTILAFWSLTKMGL